MTSLDEAAEEALKLMELGPLVIDLKSEDDMLGAAAGMIVCLGLPKIGFCTHEQISKTKARFTLIQQ